MKLTLPPARAPLDVPRIHAAVTAKDQQAQLLAQADQDPDVQAARAKNDATPDTSQTMTLADGTYHPQRQALHKTIVRKLLNPMAGPQAKPEAHFFIGLPGAGKSTIAAKLFGSPPKAMTTVNPDKAMQFLPEYDLRNGGKLHTEGATIAEHGVMPAAVALRHHLLVDFTGRSPDKVAGMAKGLQAVGYSTHLHYVHVTPQESAQRSLEDFTHGDGRFVDPKYSILELGHKIQQSYQQLRQSGAFTSVHAYPGAGRGPQHWDPTGGGARPVMR